MQEKNETQLIDDLGVLIHNQKSIQNSIERLSEKLGTMTDNQVVLIDRIIDVNKNLIEIKRLLDPSLR